MPVFHLVARARSGCRPLSSAQQAWWLWRRLRSTWPSAIAACLMPNHVHLLVKADAADAEQRRLRLAIRSLSRFAKASGLWEPVPPATVIPDAKHLLRQVRYVHLNPCRDGLAPDPLSWPWSTHRGVVGAEFRPWIDARRLAREAGMPRTGFVAWFHAYVSGDPSVNAAGTPLPIAERPACLAASLSNVRDAALSAAPLASKAVVRRVFVELCHSQGFADHAQLARLLGITHQHVLRLTKLHDDALLRAALLCLGDARLRQGAASTPRSTLFKF